MRKLLIRADDFGFSEGVNYGIAKTVYDGLIQNVGLMPNMEAATHGVSLLRGTKVCLGQHTNLCVGKPISDPALIPSLVEENGEFKAATQYRTAGRDIVVLEEAIIEVEAQYRRFVELTGEQPRYFEGHAIMSPNFFRALKTIAQRHDLPYLEFGQNLTCRFRNAQLVGIMESMQPKYDPYAALKRAVMGGWGENIYPMLVCHPGYIDDYLMTHGILIQPRPKEVTMLCDPSVAKWLEQQNVKLITYDDL